MKNIIFKTFELLLFFLPIKKGRILFYSFRGLYNDNPLYISNELVSRKINNIEIIWIISDRSKVLEFPKHVIVAKNLSFKHLIYSRTANVIVDNYDGYRSKIKKTGLFDLMYLLYKKKKQLNISTWHGTPMKKIGVKINNLEDNFTFSTSDLILSGCNYTKKIFQKSFPYSVPIYNIGTPRNDILIKKNEFLEGEIKKKLNIKQNSKIILFAPTYREDINFSGKKQLEDINLDDLLYNARLISDGEWYFIYRIHQQSMDELTHFSSKFEKNNCRAIDGNQVEDMAELLLIADVLISDYSGAIFDFSLLKRPIFLLAPDYDDYSTSRGFNEELPNIPFSISKNQKELINNFASFDQDKYKLDVEKFLKDLGNVENGDASHKVVNIIEKYIFNKCLLRESEL